MECLDVINKEIIMKQENEIPKEGRQLYNMMAKKFSKPEQLKTVSKILLSMYAQDGEKAFKPFIKGVK